MAFRAAAQNGGIASFEAKRAGIGGDVGPALVDDSDDAERHAHAVDDHAVRPGPAFAHCSDRVGQRAHDVDSFGDGADQLLIKRQAVEEGFAGAGGLGFGDVLGIGGKDASRCRANRLRHRRERLILLSRGGEGETACGRAGAPADAAHDTSNVGGRAHGFERCGHRHFSWAAFYHVRTRRREGSFQQVLAIGGLGHGAY
jgi:hypothetical protein